MDFVMIGKKNYNNAVSFAYNGDDFSHEPERRNTVGGLGRT
jgi:hypothetical protein